MQTKRARVGAGDQCVPLPFGVPSVPPPSSSSKALSPLALQPIWAPCRRWQHPRMALQRARRSVCYAFAGAGASRILPRRLRSQWPSHADAYADDAGSPSPFPSLSASFVSSVPLPRCRRRSFPRRCTFFSCSPRLDVVVASSAFPLRPPPLLSAVVPSSRASCGAAFLPPQPQTHTATADSRARQHKSQPFAAHPCSKRSFPLGLLPRLSSREAALDQIPCHHRHHLLQSRRRHAEDPRPLAGVDPRRSQSPAEADGRSSPAVGPVEVVPFHSRVHPGTATARRAKSGAAVVPVRRARCWLPRGRLGSDEAAVAAQPLCPPPLDRPTLRCFASTWALATKRRAPALRGLDGHWPSLYVDPCLLERGGGRAVVRGTMGE